MKVVRAASAGACYGVKRALDIAFDLAASGKTAQTLGPLIHNPSVVRDLESQGICVADEVGQLASDIAIVRSHGISPQEEAELQALGKTVVDATCPHVLRAQRAASELACQGRTLIVVGEPGHPEVEGLCAWASHASSGASRIVVASSPEDIPSDIEGPVGVVVQTTQRKEVLDQVVARLVELGHEPNVRNTICDATTKRQDAARELSTQVDAMVVVGGHNSSNTKRLFEICAAGAPRAFHVEKPDELRKLDFEGCKSVGITAGASTPEAQIAAIEDCLHSW